MHHYGNAWPIYVIDNGSSPEACAKVRAQYPDITLYNAPHLEYGREPHAYPHVWRFYDHLKTLFDEYEKVIVLATDAYILSQRLVDYIEGIDFGWTALWCHNHPATEISVIVRGCKAFDDFAADPYKLMGNMEEVVVPLTRIEKYFTGNRYGELNWRPGDTPTVAEMDYFTQVPDGYAWPDGELWSDDIFPVLRRVDGRVVVQ